MHVVHRGFDRIELAIQANIPPELFEYLDPKREEAEEQRKPIPVTYGGADFDLQNHGSNGYRFVLKSGPLGLTWFFKKPNARDPWGIRVNAGSILLATQGLGAARTQIDKTLTRLGIRFGAHQVSIARADFCVDLLAQDFDLIPENFVFHSHTTRADYSQPLRSHGKSGGHTSVAVGKMPGRQVIVYDKRREMIDAKKPVWWNIWNTNLTSEGFPPLNPADRTASQIWRVEIRAGKNLLKDRWQIRHWADFDAQFGDVIAEALQNVRYCEPDPHDSNRARWHSHPMWDTVSEEAEANLAELRTYLDPSAIRSVFRAEQMRLKRFAFNMTHIRLL